MLKFPSNVSVDVSEIICVKTEECFKSISCYISLRGRKERVLAERVERDSHSYYTSIFSRKTYYDGGLGISCKIQSTIEEMIKGAKMEEKENAEEDSLAQTENIDIINKKQAILEKNMVELQEVIAIALNVLIKSADNNQMERQINKPRWIEKGYRIHQDGNEGK